MASGGQTLAQLIEYLKLTQTAPNVGGVSDEIAQAYIQSSTQQQIAAMQQASQIAQQEQANKLRWAEITGTSDGTNMTDAAARWRQELTAQQAVQNARLAQEQAQLLGRFSSGEATLEAKRGQTADQQRWAELTGQVLNDFGNPTGTTTLAAQAQATQAAQRQAELMGYDAQGRATTETQRLLVEQQQSAAERQLRAALQAGQLSQQEQEFARTYLLQKDEARRAQASLTGYTDTGQMTEEQRRARAQEAVANAGMSGYLTNGQMTEEQRRARAQELLTQGTALGSINGQMTEEARRAREQEALAKGTALGTIDGQMTEEARRARAQEALTAGTALGTIGGQMTEEARAARAREALAEGTALGSVNGQMTEEQRAARAGEQQQRASTAADLTKSSRDVFRAANYFREMQRPDTTGTGIGAGAGAMGFTSQANRNLGTPGTIGYEQALSATMPGMGTAGSAAATMPSYVQPQQQEQFAALPVATQQQYMAQDTTGAPTPTPDMGASVMGSPDQTDEEKPAGSQPAGPVGMGAGGSFVGRQDPREAAKRAQALRDQLDDPRVKSFFKQVRKNLRGGEPGSRPSGPGGPQGTRKGGKTFDGALERDRRALRGLKRIRDKAQKNMLGPGMQPGGPVDAPMWPTPGMTQTTSAAPSVPTASSVGASASPAVAGYGMSASSAPSPLAAPFAQADVPGMDARLASFQELLRRYGAQGLGAQTMEAMGSTQKGVTEGALEALGLNPEDFNEAYANTRFQNNGNALLA